MRLAEAPGAGRTRGDGHGADDPGADPPPFPQTMPGPARLLAEIPRGTSGAVALVEHRRRYPAPPRPRSHGQPALIELIERSGLAGRGGAGFPTGRKLSAVAVGRTGRPVVLVNGTEGEPASGKDRLLLSRLPHLVLDGAAVAAAAVGASRVVVCVDRTDRAALAAVSRGVGERAGAGGEDGLVFEVAATPPRYVAGESSALVHWLNGGPALPTTGPPHPFQRGVDGRPTLVQNAETMAHLAQIARFGPEWFRGAGTESEPGTMLVTVSGAVARPSIIETAIGTPIGIILAGAGGLVGRPQALLMGGFFGTWVPAGEVLSAPFSRAGLAPWGARPGAVVVIALSEEACGLAETARLLGWFAAESAGQCGPCRYGLADLAAGAVGLARPHGSGQVGQLRRWADQIEGRGACHHPDGAVNLLRSALRVFADDLSGHERGGPCLGAAGPAALAVPAVDGPQR